MIQSILTRNDPQMMIERETWFYQFPLTMQKKRNVSFSKQSSDSNNVLEKNVKKII